jgi:hypothetical protein
VRLLPRRGCDKAHSTCATLFMMVIHAPVVLIMGRH